MSDANELKSLRDEVKKLREAIEARPFVAPYPLIITVPWPTVPVPITPTMPYFPPFTVTCGPTTAGGP